MIHARAPLARDLVVALLAGSSLAGLRLASRGSPVGVGPAFRGARGQPPGSGADAGGAGLTATAATPQTLEKVIFALPPSRATMSPQTVRPCSRVSSARRAWSRAARLALSSSSPRASPSARSTTLGPFSPSVRKHAGGDAAGIIAGTRAREPLDGRCAGDPVDGAAPGQGDCRFHDRQRVAQCGDAGGFEHFGCRHRYGDYLVTAPGTTERLLGHPAGRGPGRRVHRVRGAASPSARADAAGEPGGDRALARRGIATNARKLETQRDQLKRMTRAMLRAIQTSRPTARAVSGPSWRC